MKRTSYPAVPYGKTRAVASWYGPDFHGKPTSSGEIYNMYANTCAHKEYPFGTKVKVTNLQNERTVVCTVNDRGPFVEGRDIDLSYATAREIHLIGPGTGEVLLEVTGRDTTYVKKVRMANIDRTGPFAIQLGSFTDNLNAIRLKAALSLKYDMAYVHESWVSGTRYFRVRIGDFDRFEEAAAFAERLGEEGYQPLVMKAGTRL